MHFYALYIQYRDIDELLLFRTFKKWHAFINFHISNVKISSFKKILCFYDKYISKNQKCVNYQYAVP